MTMYRFRLAILAAIASAAASSGELKEEPRSVYVTAPIEIAADGHAEIGEIEGASEQLAQFARTVLSQQHYSPAHREGKPVTSTSRVGAALLLQLVGDQFEVSLGSVWVGPLVRHFVLPDYPTDMARLGKEGMVLLRIQVGPERRAVSSAVVAPTQRAFEQAAIRAVRDWRFDQLLIDGKPVSYEVIQPFWFHEDKRKPVMPEFQCPPGDSTPRANAQKACLEHVEVFYSLRRSDVAPTSHRAGSQHDR